MCVFAWLQSDSVPALLYCSCQQMVQVLVGDACVNSGDHIINLIKVMNTRMITGQFGTGKESQTMQPMTARRVG